MERQLSSKHDVPASNANARESAGRLAYTKAHPLAHSRQLQLPSGSALPVLVAAAALRAFGSRARRSRPLPQPLAFVLAFDQVERRHERRDGRRRVVVRVGGRQQVQRELLLPFGHFDHSHVAHVVHRRATRLLHRCCTTGGFGVLTVRLSSRTGTRARTGTGIGIGFNLKWNKRVRFPVH